MIGDMHMEGRQKLAQEVQQSGSDDSFAKIVREPKEFFYAKGRDSYGFRYYEENDKGCLLYLTDKLLQNLIATTYQNSSYVYSTKSKSLGYIIDGHIENVNIDNPIKLQLSLIRKMNTKSRKYDYKLLSYNEIYLLITSNGGHKPRDIEGHDIEKLFSEFGKQGQQNSTNSDNDAEELSRDIILEKTLTKRSSSKFEDFFYDKDRDLYGTESIDATLDETTVLYYLKNEKDIYDYNLAIDDYVFIDELLDLYIVRSDRLEHIKINNMESFIAQFYEKMDTIDYKYTCKCVPIVIMHQLILSNHKLITPDEQKEHTILNFNQVSTTLTEHKLEDAKKRFEIRKMPISRYSNKEKWVCSGQTYYMVGLPICIKSPSFASASSQDDFIKLIQSKISTIANADIFTSLPTNGTIRLFIKEGDAKEYLRAMRSNIYSDLTCFQSAVFEISLRDSSKTSALQAGTAYYTEEYDGLKHSMNANVIFFETDVTNVIPHKASLTIESLKGKIAELTCSLQNEHSIANQLALLRPFQY